MAHTSDPDAACAMAHGELPPTPDRAPWSRSCMRHTAPHLAALQRLGVAAAEIARIHRPIGLNIGSKTPAEIAIATLAGLIADRNGRLPT